jgi:5'-nucleotidase / UDP-sugar diphosphatase
MQSEGTIMVEAMNAMAYDAMALGAYDLYLGLEILAHRMEDAEFPMLSGNLRAPEGDLIAPSHIVIGRDGVTFGIIGLTEPDAMKLESVEKLVHVDDPETAARPLVEALQDEVDVLLVLSHLGLDADLALAEAVQGIDIIIGGNTRRLMQVPQRVGNTVIVQQGYAGEWIGRLQVTYDADWNIIGATEDLITLDETYADDPELKSMRDAWAERWPSPTPEPSPTPTPMPTQTGG